MRQGPDHAVGPCPFSGGANDPPYFSGNSCECVTVPSGPVDAGRDLAVADVAFEQALVVVYQHRKTYLVVGRMERIAVRVSRQHHVDVRIVQDRQKQLFEMDVAVPGAVPERDVQQHDAGRSVAELLRSDRFAQPGGLLLAVGVVSPQSAVFDVRVGFVLAAVEQKHGYRAGHVELVVVAPDLGKVLRQVVGVDAARLVVAAVVEDRQSRRRRPRPRRR